MLSKNIGYLIRRISLTFALNIFLLQDEQLLEQLRNPKTQDQAFRTLVQNYQVRLYHHLRSILLNHEDTDDVLQNTFIKVYQNIHNFKGQSQLFSWIYRIATNEALTFLKQKAKRHQISDLTLQEQAIESLVSDPLFDGDEAALLLQKAVALLPEKQQLVFKMRYFEDLDYQTISEILQVSIGGLKASYHHAVKKIETFIKSR